MQSPVAKKTNLTTRFTSDMALPEDTNTAHRTIFFALLKSMRKLQNMSFMRIYTRSNSTNNKKAYRVTEEELTTLPPDVSGEIDAIMAKIQDSTPGFYSRPEQYRMIRALAKTFLDNGTIVVEGPTGVGKSLSYILSGSVMAPRLKKKIVIATATVSLQEQLVSRDIPEFIAKSGMDIRFGIAKGRSRYACTARLARLGSTKSNDSILVDSRTLNLEESEILTKLSVALKN